MLVKLSSVSGIRCMPVFGVSACCNEASDVSDIR